MAGLLHIRKSYQSLKACLVFFDFEGFELYYKLSSCSSNYITNFKFSRETFFI